MVAIPFVVWHSLNTRICESLGRLKFNCERIHIMDRPGQIFGRIVSLQFASNRCISAQKRRSEYFPLNIQFGSIFFFIRFLLAFCFLAKESFHREQFQFTIRVRKFLNV